MQRLPFGTKVKDQYNGRIGIVTAVCEYATGCLQYGVESKADKQGKVETWWIDEDRLAVQTAKRIVLKSPRARKTQPRRKPPGGPQEFTPGDASQ
jgi:predicted metalloendopeptidase